MHLISSLISSLSLRRTVCAPLPSSPLARTAGGNHVPRAAEPPTWIPRLPVDCYLRDWELPSYPSPRILGLSVFFPKTWPPVEEGREQLVGIVWRAEPAPCILLGGPGEPSASGRQEGPPQGVVGIPGLPRARGLPRAPHGPVVPSGHLPPLVPPLCPASGSYLALHVHSLDTMQVITHTLAPRCFSSLGDTSSEV